MHHVPNQTRPTMTGPADKFSGDVALDPIYQPDAPARAQSLNVTFQPGARTAWHTHPLGQTIFVTAGKGRAQKRGGEIVELNPGDTVWFAADEEHWHGAAPDSAMTHVAIQEALDGTSATWLEQVSDADYAPSQDG